MVKVFKPASYRKRKRGTSYTWKKKNRRLVSDESKFRSVVPLVRRPDFGFPDKFVTRLRYCDSYALAGSNNNVFRLNSLYDPDLSGVGHKPTWMNQICGAVGTAPYSKYRVLGAKITVKFCELSPPSLAAANYSPVLCYIACDQNGSLSYSTAQNVMEGSGNVWTVLMGKEGGNNVKQLSMTYSPTRDLGMTVGDDTTSANYNGNPSNQFYAIVGKIDQGNSSNTQFYVEIEYLAEFFQRNEVDLS